MQLAVAVGSLSVKEGFESLRAYELAYASAMKVFELSKSFPNDEKYSLTDQIRRSSRSVCGNIAEAYRKRRYRKHYVSKLSDADGESSETIVWLHFARDCGYISPETHSARVAIYEQIGKLLGYMMDHPEKFGA